MAKPKHPPGDPMTLSNMRQLGVRGPRAVAFGLLGYGSFLFVYSVIVTLGYNSRAFQAWVGTFQTVSDLMSSFIPALEVNKGSKAGLGLAVQHLLFVGWSLLINFVLWTVVDVSVVRRSAWERSWDRLYRFFCKAKLARLVVLMVVIVAGCLTVLLGGLGLMSDGKSLFGSVVLVWLAGSFFVTATIVFVLILSGCALLQRLLA